MKSLWPLISSQTCYTGQAIKPALGPYLMTKHLLWMKNGKTPLLALTCYPGLLSMRTDLLFILLEEVGDVVSKIHKGLEDTRLRLMGQTLTNWVVWCSSAFRQARHAGQSRPGRLHLLLTVEESGFVVYPSNHLQEGHTDQAGLTEPASHSERKSQRGWKGKSEGDTENRWQTKNTDLRDRSCLGTSQQTHKFLTVKYLIPSLFFVNWHWS